MVSLTEHLLTRHTDALKEASEHDFLTRAGQGKLTAYALTKWLVQDKYYQFGYLKFIGRMCSNLNLDSYAFPAKDEENLDWKTFNTLVTALQAIRDEIDFYNETVAEYGLELKEERPDDNTEAYRRLFEKCSQPGLPIVHGLTVLWATEFVYLRAWSHAKKNQTESQEGEGAIAALHQAFIPRWTSEEFETAVKALAEVLNQWAERETGETQKCEQLWGEVLDLEIKFWPIV